MTNEIELAEASMRLQNFQYQFDKETDNKALIKLMSEIWYLKGWISAKCEESGRFATDYIK